MRSPLTQGGLEIKSKVSVKWGVNSRAKFVLFKEHVEKNYIFVKRCEDDSAKILESIKKLMIVEVSNEEEEENAEIEVDNAIPILVDYLCDDDEEI